MQNEFISDLVLDSEAGTIKDGKESKYKLYSDGCTEIIESNNNGKILTLCMKSQWYFDNEYCTHAAKSLSNQLKKLIKNSTERILCVGIGNRFSCADKLGCEVISRLNISGICTQGRIFALSSGTYEQSGFDIADASSAMAELLGADLIIAVDALKTSSYDRLCSVIELSSCGILPGSGVGNTRKELSFSKAGVPVISIGFPTVLGVKSREEYSIFTLPDINHIVDQSSKIIFEGIVLSFCE